MKIGLCGKTVHSLLSRKWKYISVKESEKEFQKSGIIFWGKVGLTFWDKFSSVAQSCPTLCEPMDCSMPGLPVHHQLPELTQTHVHWFGDAVQPSHPRSSPSSPAFTLSQHQGLFKWVSFSHQVAKVYVFIYLSIHKQCYSSQGSIWVSFFLLIIFFAIISWVTSVHSASKLFLHYGIVLLSVSLLPWIDWRQNHYYLLGNAIL